MLVNGDNPEKVTDATFAKGLKRIKDAFKSGQIRSFTGNDYADKLAKGDIVAAVAYSGDMVQLLADNPHLKFQIPREGGMVWTDNMLIPKHGDAHNASVFMNFVYDPRIAAEIEDSVNYICPVQGAAKVLLKSDPAVAKNTLIFPTPKMRSQLHRMDPKALFNGDYKTAVAEGARGVGRAVGVLHRHRWLTPYLLLAPGLALPRHVLRRAARVPREAVARDGRHLRASATASTGPGTPTRTRSRATTSSSCARSSTRRSRRSARS